jgi:hypothetical protein
VGKNVTSARVPSAARRVCSSDIISDASSICLSTSTEGNYKLYNYLSPAKQKHYMKCDNKIATHKQHQAAVHIDDGAHCCRLPFLW